MSNKEIRALAQKALLLSDGAAKWFAIDLSGMVYAYKLQPVIRDVVWDIDDVSYDCWEIAEVARPDNFRQELYQISKILDNENE